MNVCICNNGAAPNLKIHSTNFSESCHILHTLFLEATPLNKYNLGPLIPVTKAFIYNCNIILKYDEEKKS